MSIIQSLSARHIPELTINWHILEACNYGCTYCYAKWSTERSGFGASWPAVIEALAQLPGRRLNLHPEAVVAGDIRLNFAGGEPFLEKSLGAAIEAAHLAGLRPSFISNGSMVTDAFIEQYGPMISVAGFSFDSFSPSTRDKIGRRMKSRPGLDQVRLADMLSRFRRVSPKTILKVNTVVCEENVAEDMRSGLAILPLDRWKMLRVIPIHGGQPIKDEDFDAFVSRHSQIPGSVIETNEDMARSYLMLNPERRPYQRVGDDYVYGEDIVQSGAERAFAGMEFDADAYLKRY
jgi:radical S-adenosyl methionine domain-containing protein 2